MRSKTFIILVLVCCALGGIAYFITSEDDSAQKQGKMGEKLLPDLSLGDIASVNIKDHENSVTLKKGEEVWGIEEKFNYPANFSKIMDVVEKLRDAKIGRVFKAGDKTLSRLSLHSPDKADTPTDEKGSRIILEDKEKKVLADIIIGKSRDASAGAGGHYVTFAKDYFTVYLVDKSFRFLDKKSEQWLDKKLLEVKAEDVEKVVCLDPESEKAIYTLRRPEKGKDPEFADPPLGKKVKKSKADEVFKALSNFRIDNIADPVKKTDETGLDKASCFEIHLFDGTVYKAYPGAELEDEKDKFYFKTDVSYIAPTVTTEEKEGGKEEDKETDAGYVAPTIIMEEKEGGEEAEDKETDEPKAKKAEEEKIKQAEVAAEAKKLNEKLSPWIYVISKWKHDDFITDSESLLEDAEVPKAETMTEKTEIEKPATPVETQEAEVKDRKEAQAETPKPETEKADKAPETPVETQEAEAEMPKPETEKADKAQETPVETQEAEAETPKPETEKADKATETPVETQEAEVKAREEAEAETPKPETEKADKATETPVETQEAEVKTREAETPKPETEKAVETAVETQEAEVKAQKEAESEAPALKEQEPEASEGMIEKAKPKTEAVEALKGVSEKTKPKTEASDVKTDTQKEKPEADSEKAAEASEGMIEKTKPETEASDVKTDTQKEKPEADSEKAEEAVETQAEPDSEKPDSEEPDSEEPDSKEPDSEEPDSEEPDSEEPDSEEPDSKEPDSEEPEEEIEAEEKSSDSESDEKEGGIEMPKPEPDLEIMHQEESETPKPEDDSGEE
ncbi:DUF4340 domain-containing protein [Desulfobacterales bacterium HSG2]|nr:DUF4340 domain-containing protein [Desulfobacterales bacterium HSG2]